MRYPELLAAMHGFLVALGVDEVRRRAAADDKPLRMFKTLLHELCKLQACVCACACACVRARVRMRGGGDTVDTECMEWRGNILQKEKSSTCCSPLHPP